jgi:hypothetical protein
MEKVRTRAREEALRKHQILSYSFHVDVYCRPHLRYLELTDVLKRSEVNLEVLEIPEYARSGMIYLFERLVMVNQSSVHQWWYIFWVSMLRWGNFRTIFGGGITETLLLVFCMKKSFHQRIRRGKPAKSTESSICYTPLPRQRLTEFLQQRGLWRGPFRYCFHDGLLNRSSPPTMHTHLEMYLRMNSLLYGNSLQAALQRHPSKSSTSGTQTQAPRSKVLRWKDLESAAEESAAQVEHSSLQSVFGTEDGEHEVLKGNAMWENEMEELFI